MKRAPGRPVTDTVAIGPVTYHTCKIMRILPVILLISTALIASGKGIAAQIDSGVMQEATSPDLEAMQSDGVTLSQAVEQVRRQYNGRIVSAETQLSGNRETHIIKVLTEDGKVKTVRVPGKLRG